MSSQYFLAGSNLEKCGNVLEKQTFLRADMARLGKYSMGGYFHQLLKNILKIVYFFKTMSLL